MKKVLLVVFSIILMLSIVYAEVGVTDTEIKIGTFQAMSGPVAVIGQSVANGMNAYFNYVNDNGGIFGRKINLIIADDQFNPAKTTVEVKRLVENDKVFALVGGLGTPGNLAVMNYVNNSKVPYVYQASGSSLLAIPPKKYIFPVQPNYTLEGNIVMNYLVKTKRAKKIAIIYRNDDAGKEFLNSAVETLKNKYNMKPVETIAINPIANDFSTEITKLIAKRPDAIAVMLFIPQSVNFVKQAKQYGLQRQKYVLTYANSDVSYILLAKEAAEGVEAMAWVNVDFSKPDLKVFQIYRKYFDQMPNAYAIAGMIAAEVFVEAVTRAGEDLTRENLVKALESMNKWTGMLAHEITYKPYNPEDNTCRLGKQSMYVLRVRKGVWSQMTNWIYYEK
ncbi:amino acid/amide ABC transporter substrate-binding protein, HAAT family [Marinitoga hydrogenitolerans DSM 16785]|uniref:Amino acid/amide ABC transporter substrate-binding protein, HAAT family n=1 Tax=Marinitoga hydrogenitolerans (strain DSM 16785 / JCM 12826 / AT1271) TaxID=1122195 RepID=A0A1M4XBK2_MARH1|nr:ABC transporter substrate-binding protein [Marinitoga hydrogenitolerans]SHE90676.1 amino acid/amide ABC transporter substrate-binding protein, HAAT family [Marinitoga hydrogenitolerans DSM 16785]